MGQEQGKVESGSRTSSITHLKSKFRRRDGSHQNSLDHSVPEATTPDEPDSPLANSMRWDSRDKLNFDDNEECDINADPHMVVAVHTFMGGGPEQLTVHAGDELRVTDYSEQRDWCQATNRRGECGWVPSNYIKPINSIEKHSWFHGPISRNEAEYLLSSGINGSFLVRESESNPGQHSVSLRYEGRVFHYRIQVNPEGFKYISQDHYFKTLPELIHHHSQQPDGLITILRYPATKPNAPVFGIPQKGDRWEIKKNDIQMHDRLGGGQYGEVYKARWKSCNKIVAVKTFREDTMDASDFLKEAAVMKKVKHKNLVQLLGVCTLEPPFFIITEYMLNGNLLDYLRGEVGRELDAVTLMYVATQVASAMAYLEQKNYIHRDLAARNCLVGDNNLVKVADFGLSRLLKEDIYTASQGAKFPIKWTAPEALAYNSFSTKSDVWSFGVLLWEIATYGMTPYPGMELSAVYTSLDSGERMMQPEGCPDEIYQLMQGCWQWDVEDRPTFSEIHKELNSMFHDSGGVTHAVKKALKDKKKDSKGDSRSDSPSSVNNPASPGIKSHKSRKDHSSHISTSAHSSLASSTGPPASPISSFKSGLDDALSKRASLGSSTLPLRSVHEEGSFSTVPSKRKNSHDELKFTGSFPLQPSPPVPLRQQSTGRGLSDRPMCPLPPSPPPTDYNDDSSSPPPLPPPRDFIVPHNDEPPPPPIPSAKNKPRLPDSFARMSGPPPLPSFGSKPQMRHLSSQAPLGEQEDQSALPPVPTSSKPYTLVNGPGDWGQQKGHEPPPLPPDNIRPQLRSIVPDKPLPARPSNAQPVERDDDGGPPPLPTSSKPHLDRGQPASNHVQKHSYLESPPVPSVSTKPSLHGPPIKPLPPLPGSASTGASLSSKPFSRHHDASQQHVAKPPVPPISAKPAFLPKPPLPSAKPAVLTKPNMKPPVQTKPTVQSKPSWLRREASSSNLLSPLIPMKDKVTTMANKIMTRQSQLASRKSENLQECFDAFSSSVSALLDKTDDITDSHVVVLSKQIQSKLMEFRNLTRRTGGCPSDGEMVDICSAIEAIMNLVNDLFR